MDESVHSLPNNPYVLTIPSSSWAYWALHKSSDAYSYEERVNPVIEVILGTGGKYIRSSSSIKVCAKYNGEEICKNISLYLDFDAHRCATNINAEY